MFELASNVIVFDDLSLNFVFDLLKFLVGELALRPFHDQFHGAFVSNFGDVLDAKLVLLLNKSDFSLESNNSVVEHRHMMLHLIEHQTFSKESQDQRFRKVLFLVYNSTTEELE